MNPTDSQNQRDALNRGCRRPLRSIGEDVPDDLLALTSPIGSKHIAFAGDFLWKRAAAGFAGRRELNTMPMRYAA